MSEKKQIADIVQWPLHRRKTNSNNKEWWMVIGKPIPVDTGNTMRFNLDIRLEDRCGRWWTILSSLRTTICHFLSNVSIRASNLQDIVSIFFHFLWFVSWRLWIAPTQVFAYVNIAGWWSTLSNCGLFWKIWSEFAFELDLSTSRKRGKHSNLRKRMSDFLMYFIPTQVVWFQSRLVILCCCCKKELSNEIQNAEKHCSACE